MDININNKEGVPLEHYCKLYRALDPEEVTARTGVLFDGGRSAFVLTVLGYSLIAAWPEFSLTPEDPACPAALYTAGAQILMIRYLLEGRYERPSGRFIAYREMPWGAVYDRNFQGRCIKRLAFGFGSRLDAFAKAAEQLGGLPVKLGDVAYDLPFFGHIVIRIALWAGDDEFPPNSQILFSDNIIPAFSTEDAAVIGDVFIDALKELSKRP